MSQATGRAPQPIDGLETHVFAYFSQRSTHFEKVHESMHLENYLHESMHFEDFA